MFIVLFVTMLASPGGHDQPAELRTEPRVRLQLVQHRPGGRNQFEEPPQGFGAFGGPPQGLGIAGGIPPFPQQGQPPVFLPEPPIQQVAPAKKQTEEIPPLVWLGVAALVLFIVWRMGNRTIRIVHRR